MKTLGRIFLAVVGIALIVFGIISITNDSNAINDLGGFNWEMFTDPQKRNLIFSIICQGINIGMGITALVAALLGRAGFWLTIFSIVQLALLIIFIVTGAQAGTLAEIKSIFTIVLGIVCPGLYFLGSVLIRFKGK